MSDNIKAFVAALKVRLEKRATELDKGCGNTIGSFLEDNRRYGSTMTGQWGSVDVDWDALNAEIDAFAAEFEKEKKP